MQVSILKKEADRPLKAVYSKVTGSVYLKSREAGSCIHYLDCEGNRHITTYKSLEQILAERKENLIPVYKGDSITITF